MVGGLGALGEPLRARGPRRASIVEGSVCGVVLADGLDDAAVARGALVGDDDAPDRVLLAAHAGEPESNCHGGPLEAWVSGGEADACRLAGLAHASRPRSGILPRPSCFISLRIWPNCLTSWLTAWTFVPEPLAMRRRREPLMSSGRRRSSGVIDRMIAWMRSSSRSSTFRPLSCWPAKPGIMPSSDCSGPILRICLELLEEVLERELVAAQLALELLGLVLVELALGLLDERHDVAHAEDALGHAVGVEALELVELLARRGEEDRLAGDRLDAQRGAAAGVAVELGHHDAVELHGLGELLGDVDGVLAGHRVDDEQDRVRLDRVADVARAPPSAPRRRAGARRCRR